MERDGVRLEVEGRIASVILDRPPVNAVSTGVYRALIEIFNHLGQGDEAEVVIVRSANEKLFCAGADIREVEDIVNSGTSDRDVQRQALARETYDLLLDLPQPTIAVVNGAALGAGAVLVACCDIRVGSSKARIGLSEINVARCGGGRHMMRLLPQGVVRRMYFTGEAIDAATAEHFGFLTDVHPPGEEVKAAIALAEVIASKSPLALRMAKQALNASEPLSVAEGYPVEQQFTLKLGRSQDAKEATRAFLEKRDPVWTGA